MRGRRLLLVGCLLLASLACAGSPAPKGGGGEDARVRLVQFPIAETDWMVAYSRDGKKAAIVGSLPERKHRIRVVDLATGQDLASTGELTGPIPFWQAFSFNNSGKRLATFSRRNLEFDDCIQFWNITGKGKVAAVQSIKEKLFDHRDLGSQLEFSPDGTTLAMASAEEVISLWDTTTGKVKRRFYGGVAASFSADGKTLVAVSHDGEVRRFDTTKYQLISPKAAAKRSEFLHVSHAIFSRDGKRVAIGDHWTTLIKDAASNRTVCRIAVEGGTWPVSFSIDGKLLAVLDIYGITHICDAATGKERGWVPASEGPAEFLGDGKHLVCQGKQSIKLLEITNVLAKANPAPPPPRTIPGLPLEVELIARTDKYTLDLEGFSPEKYSVRCHADAGLPPAMDLELRFHNTGKKPLTIANRASPGLFVVGPGAFNMDSRWIDMSDPPTNPRAPLIIPPGATRSIRIPDLAPHHPGLFLLPGEYTIVGYYLPEFRGPRALYLPPAKIKVLPARKRPAGPRPQWQAHVSEPLAPGTPFVARSSEAVAWSSLAQRVVLPEGIDNEKLEDVLGFLAERHDTSIRINQPAFNKAGKKNIGQSKVTIKPFPPVARDFSALPLYVVLQMVLEQADARLEIRGNTVWIEPLAKPLALKDRLGPTHHTLRRWLQPKGIPPGTTLESALDNLQKDLEFPAFCINQRAFAQAKVKDIAKKKVQLGPQQDVPLSEVLEKLLKPIGATFVARERMVLIEPK